MSGQVTEDSTVQIRVPVATTSEFDAIKKKGIAGWDETRGVFVVCPADDADFEVVGGGGGVGIPGTGTLSEVHNAPYPTNASGASSFSANDGQASGSLSFACNNDTFAIGPESFASGNSGTALGNYSAVFGYACTSWLNGSFSIGNQNNSKGLWSYTSGIMNIGHYLQTVIGQYATDEGTDDGAVVAGQSLFKVGNGVDGANRADAFRVNEDGTAYHAKRISYGIWNGYAEGPVDFTGGLSGGGNIPTNGTNVLGNAPVLKGSRTIPNDIANMALGDTFRFEWLGRIVHTSGGALYFKDLNAGGVVQPMYITTLASNTYYAKVTGKYIVSQIIADVPQIKLEWNVELRSGDGFANPMVVAINDAYATQDSGGGAFFAISSPLTFAFGINAANATRPKQISFRMWRE